MTRRVLVLAGTAEARGLCAALAADDRFAPLASLAGATEAPSAYACETRRGGFGGREALARFLVDARIERLVDATHPFAAGISDSAVAAAAAAGVALLRLERPAWTPRDGVAWREVADGAAADAAIPAGARAFLAVGRRSLGPFCERADYWRAARVIDPPAEAPPFAPGVWEVGRPPFSEAAERATFRRLGITHLAAKNSGGVEGWAKLSAAAAAGIEILMIARPEAPPAETATSISAAVAWAGRAV